MKIAVGNSRIATKWQNQEITWEQFCERVMRWIGSPRFCREFCFTFTHPFRPASAMDYKPSLKGGSRAVPVRCRR